MKKFLIFFSGLYGVLVAKPALAICPVCTIAVGAGVGFAQYLGIDDSISGLWIGGLTVSMIMWTINWFNKKNWRFKGRKIITTLAYYAMIVIPLHYSKIIWHPYNTMWGMDKLLLGIGVGSVVFFVAALWYEDMKKKNGGHAYFPFQKVAMPVGGLALFSVLFYFLSR